METGGGLVLVCDDTEPIRRLIRVNLELDGYDVEEVSDGGALLDRLRRPGAPLPGVVILDADNGKYMNHSMTPNTDFRIFDRGYALADIAAGDEITCNYHEFDPTFAGAFSDLIAGAGHQEIGRHTNGR